MIVTVREHDAFDTAGTRRQRLADRCRRDGLERAIAVLQPQAVQRIKARPFECVRGSDEAVVRGSTTCPRDRADLLEVPGQLLNRTQVERTLQFVTDHRLQPHIHVRDRTRKHQAECPGLKRSKEGRVTTEERSKVVLSSR